MSCKYLGKVRRRAPDEVGGRSGLPSYWEDFTCRLGREPNAMFGASKCQETAGQGSCWPWQELHPDVPDEQFK